MNGAQSLIQTLVNGGVEVCFTNPGTSEMHFVAAVDKVDGMRTVLCLFEGVATGAADGYARMTSKPAATLLHLGPGLGNGLANLHNGRRAETPIVNIVGDHATYHLQHDAPLTSDIHAIAGAVSGWVHSSPDATSLPEDAADAIAAAMTPPGQVATLILPADSAWNASTTPAPAPTFPQPTPVDAKAVSQIAQVLRKGEPTVIFMTGEVLMEEGLRLASRISRATGARIMCRTANRRIQSGAGRPIIEQQPYPVSQALKTLAGTAHIILVGAAPPVAFFAYPNQPSLMIPDDCQIHALAKPGDDTVGALKALAEELDASEELAAVYQLNRPAMPTGELDPPAVWATLGALMPEHSIIVNEAVTSGRGSAKWLSGAPPYDLLYVTGGAIGSGMPMAVGAAVACPDRKVFNMEADGSAMYTLQSLWTQARENLDVVTVLFSNRAYAILQMELKNVGADAGGPKAQRMLDLDNPTLDWVQLGQGMGVPATRATTAEEFGQQLEVAIQESGPRLIEVVL